MPSRTTTCSSAKVRPRLPQSAGRAGCDAAVRTRRESRAPPPRSGGPGVVQVHVSVSIRHFGGHRPVPSDDGPRDGRCVAGHDASRRSVPSRRPFAVLAPPRACSRALSHPASLTGNTVCSFGIKERGELRRGVFEGILSYDDPDDATPLGGAGFASFRTKVSGARCTTVQVSLRSKLKCVPRAPISLLLVDRSRASGGGSCGRSPRSSCASRQTGGRTSSCSSATGTRALKPTNGTARMRRRGQGTEGGIGRSLDPCRAFLPLLCSIRSEIAIEGGQWTTIAVR